MLRGERGEVCVCTHLEREQGRGGREEGRERGKEGRQEVKWEEQAKRKEEFTTFLLEFSCVACCSIISAKFEGLRV